MVYFILIFVVLFVYFDIVSLKKRVLKLEQQLTSMEGTDYYHERSELVKLIRSYINQAVNIELKEDYEDLDLLQKEVVMTVLEVDKDCLLLEVNTENKTYQKIIRVEGISSISLKKNDG